MNLTRLSCSLLFALLMQACSSIYQDQVLQGSHNRPGSIYGSPQSYQVQHQQTFNPSSAQLLGVQENKVYPQVMYSQESPYQVQYKTVSPPSQSYQVSNPSSKNFPCQVWNGYSCVLCCEGYFKDADGQCHPLQKLCKDFDFARQQCRSCYIGYLLIKGVCTVSDWQERKEYEKNPLCAQWRNEECLKCSPRSYFINNGKICQLVDPNCQEYNKVTGQCLKCYQGYSLAVNKACNLMQPQHESGYLDLFCAIWDSPTFCRQCAPGTFMHNGRCAKIDPSCKRFSLEISQCVDCYDGYELHTNRISCVIKAQTIAPSGYSDPFCAIWDSPTFCRQCATGTFMYNGRCTKIDPSCKRFSLEISQCVDCYDGYELHTNRMCCVVKPQTIGPSGYSDPFCAIWDSPTFCRQCAPGTFMYNGICTQIDPKCKNFDYPTRSCLECYQGSSLLFGKCYTFSTDIFSSLGQTEPWRCQRWFSGKCQFCSQGFSLNFSTQKCECSDL